MKKFKSRKVNEIIKQWIDDSDFSQAMLAKSLCIDASVLSRQLNGNENFSADRINKIIGILKPSEEEVSKLNAVLYTDHYDASVPLKDLSVEFNIKTVQGIGPDPLLLQFLIFWSGFTNEQKKSFADQAYLIHYEKNKKITEEKK